MRYDRWYRPLAIVCGLGPNGTIIRVADDTLHVKHGWAFRLDVPLEDIKSARLAPRDRWRGGSIRWETLGWSTLPETVSSS